MEIVKDIYHDCTNNERCRICKRIADGFLIKTKCNYCEKPILKTRAEFVKSKKHYCNSSCSATKNNTTRTVVEYTLKKPIQDRFVNTIGDSFVVNPEELLAKNKAANRKLHAKICVGCNSPYLGRSTSSYCSRKCRYTKK